MWKSILSTCSIPRIQYGHLWIILLLLLDPVTRINALPNKKYALYFKRKPLPSRDKSSPEFSGLAFSESYNPSSLEADETLFTQGTFHVPPESLIPFVTSDALVEGKWSQPAVDTLPSNFHPIPSVLLPSTSSSVSDHNASPFTYNYPIQSFTASGVNSESQTPPSPLFVNPSNHFTTTSEYVPRVETSQIGSYNEKESSLSEIAVTSDYSASSDKVSSLNLSNQEDDQHVVSSVKQQRTVSDTGSENLNIGGVLKNHDPGPSVLFNTSKSQTVVGNTSHLLEPITTNSSAHKSPNRVNVSASPDSSENFSGVTYSVHTELQTAVGKFDVHEPVPTHLPEEVVEVSSQVEGVSSAATNSFTSLEDKNTVDPQKSVPTSLPPLSSVEGSGDALPSVDNNNSKSGSLASGAVAGIVIAVLICATLLTSTVIYCLYRRYNGKCTSAVESKFNSDNCGYLDDSLRSSVYLNNHIELPKESSEEMTSLDNDSFLNSLETMTIQNYWADNTKNTKV